MCYGLCWDVHTRPDVEDKADLLLEGGHAGDEEQGGELDGALHVEVRLREGLQELPEGGREEGVVLFLAHLRSSSHRCCTARSWSAKEVSYSLTPAYICTHHHYRRSQPSWMT